MHSFHYRNGSLYCEEVDLSLLANDHGTPLYVYSAATIRDHYRRLSSALSGLDHHIAYAVKANSNLAILKMLAEEGAGFDIVSGGELFRVLRAGGQASGCTFAGVGKTREEIEYALKEGIYCFNAESEAELCFIDKVAGELGKIAPVALRVNPNVDAKTHKYISTGKSENKFGVDFDDISGIYARAAKELKNVSLRGLQMHIGSQLTSVQPFVEAVEKVAPLAAQLKADHQIEFFSIGGGIGIVYEDTLASGSKDWWDGKSGEDKPLTLEEYAQAIIPTLQPLDLKILLEPGRMIVGNAGVLLSRVLYKKQGAAKVFAIVDAGMGELIRPALYQGHHDIIPVTESERKAETLDVVGPICESGDFFAQDRELPGIEEGDLIALLSAGAYGFVMASNYNSRPFPAEILVDGPDARLIRRRQGFNDLISGEEL